MQLKIQLNRATWNLETILHDSQIGHYFESVRSSRLQSVLFSIQVQSKLLCIIHNQSIKMDRYLRLSKNENDLFVQVLSNNIGKVRELLDPLNTEQLINIRNCVDRYGRTPLFGAAMACKAEMLQLLLDHGVDVNHKDRDGCTVIHRIITDDTYHVDEALFMNAKTSTWEIKKQKRNGYSGYSGNGLSGYDRLASIPVLLAYNADVSIQDNNGNTPLHLICYEKGLCRKKLKVVVRLFIEDGIDVTLRNNVNIAAVDIVKAKSLHEIREQIKEVHKMQCSQACYSFLIKKWGTMKHENNVLPSNNKNNKIRKRKNVKNTSSSCQPEVKGKKSKKIVA